MDKFRHYDIGLDGFILNVVDMTVVYPLYSDGALIRQTWSRQPKDIVYVKENQQQAFSSHLLNEFPSFSAILRAL